MERKDLLDRETLNARKAFNIGKGEGEIFCICSEVPFNY
jgi:hypothetical protein